VVVSRHDPEPPRALVLYVPLTTQNRLSAYEVPIPKLPFLDRDSVANVQGLGSIPTVRLERKLGSVPNDVLTKLKSALAFALDLESDRSGPPTGGTRIAMSATSPISACVGASRVAKRNYPKMRALNSGLDESDAARQLLQKIETPLERYQ